MILSRRHLSSGAPEPVNVDSHARQIAIEGLDTASPTLFSPAQKQVRYIQHVLRHSFNKFRSIFRFTIL